MRSFNRSRILVLDTVHRRLDVYLLGERSVSSLGQITLKPNLDQQLAQKVRDLLQGLSLADVDGYAVVAGPGSWTGARVGITAIKAYNLVHPKPIIALNTLDIIQGSGDFPVALHSGSDNYFTKRGNEYSYEKLAGTEEFLLLEEDSYRKNLVHQVKEKWNNQKFVQNLDAIYVAEFRV